jgi:hypothetical protein
MTTKGAFFSIAGFLVLSFLVGFRNADTTPWSETSAAIPKEETLVIEKFVSDGLRTECAADIGFCCVDDEGFCFDPKPNGFSASGGLRTRCITYTRNYLAPKLIGFSASDGLHTECVADTGFCCVNDTGFCLDPKPNGLSASE